MIKTEHFVLGVHKSLQNQVIGDMISLLIILLNVPKPPLACKFFGESIPYYIKLVGDGLTNHILLMENVNFPMKEIYAINAHQIMQSLEVISVLNIKILKKIGSESCVSCKTDKMYYVKFVGFFAIQIIALLYGIK